MRAMIVDTDVVSYIYKKDTRAAKYEPHFVNAITSINFMTLAELERWAIARNWGSRRHAEMLRTVLGRFTVIESSHALCRKWAEVSEQAHRLGRVIRADVILSALSSGGFCSLLGFVRVSLRQAVLIFIISLSRPLAANSLTLLVSSFEYFNFTDPNLSSNWRFAACLPSRCVQMKL